ncbi:class I SAM-dependent methyltransferase [Phenylobacterium sp.]|uniref:class I SAM-dependent methyltransferase n=1 Tax=Phenylobacterium sp. TaxID=1871053 RepID=UPI0012082BDF|nr:class I SAM-dependent methyltransferase [Phenylobacterium sp.]THD52392.1 MAG: class I SAM-dependent methyltransferase [Phenylobacterium sp.]
MIGTNGVGSVAGGLADQLRNPHGAPGRLIGAAMRLVNRQPNSFAIQALDVRASHDVLELGFGPGEGIRTLARLSPAGTIYGVDQSPTMLAQASARNRAAILRGHVQLSRAQFIETELPEQSVDRILAVNVAYFWSDGPAVLAELDRVLRPGGRISIYVTDVATMAHWQFSTSGHHRVFSASQLSDLLVDGPFAPCRITVKSITLRFGISGLLGVVAKPR